MTNGDYIRGMSDAELAVMFVKSAYHKLVNGMGEEDNKKYEVILDFLKDERICE